ncbi:MAG: YkgJ family cysteine cluster protein [archaeon]
MEATLILYLVILLCFLYLYFKSDIISFLFKKNFKCTNCTQCCKLRVKLSKKDIERIKTELDYIETDKGKKWIKRVNNYCIFMNIKQGKSRCSIYKNRPDICRVFPVRRIFGFKSYDHRCKAFKFPKILSKK